jgi:hypothetical protein
VHAYTGHAQRFLASARLDTAHEYLGAQLTVLMIGLIHIKLPDGAIGVRVRHHPSRMYVSRKSSNAVIRFSASIRVPHERGMRQHNNIYFEVNFVEHDFVGQFNTII